MAFFLFIMFCISSNFCSYAQPEDGYKIFLLKETKGIFYLEPVSINEGVKKSFKQSDIITFIIPVGVGKSGDIVQAIEKNNIINIYGAGGEMEVSIVDESGNQRFLPKVKYSDLQSYFIRVNVISGNGRKKAFYIKNYNEYGDADGPVFDLFGGRIPMAEGDYSVTTEVSKPKEIKYIAGTANLEIRENLLFVKGKTNAQTDGYFIIDFGAGRTVFSKEYIPAGSSITGITSVQYSADGIKTSEGELGAAGGSVPGLLGNTVVEKFSFGNLVLNNLPVTVVETLPAIAGKKVSGIIGMDILQMAKTVSIEYSRGKGGKIVFEQDMITAADHYKIPFFFINNQIFIDGQINDRPVAFLFDTGARYSFVSNGLGLRTIAPGGPVVRGLDGNSIPSDVAEVNNFLLGQTEFKFKDFYSADLPVINNLGLKDTGALLGGNFFREFNVVNVNFTDKVIIIEE